MSSKKFAITFGKSASKFILSCFKMKVDRNGYIKYRNGKRVKAIDGEYIKLSEFGGICKGGIIRHNIVSLISAYNRGCLENIK